ncbi:MAG: cupin domain-containing protein, partial [Armatimonadetes bacterium]|nr:cupin domain-containing protein [Armatimonadota bacterium]
GWKWSDCIKPTAGTETCMSQHVLYVLSGRMMVAMNDGERYELKAGDTGVIPPGHDAWIVGDEPCVLIDFTAGADYGRK